MRIARPLHAPAQQVHHLAAVPAGALAEFPPAWSDRVRAGGGFGCHSSPFVDLAIAEAIADAQRTGAWPIRR